jgi:hypothetical protein
MQYSEFPSTAISPLLIDEVGHLGEIDGAAKDSDGDIIGENPRVDYDGVVSVSRCSQK